MATKTATKKAPARKTAKKESFTPKVIKIAAIGETPREVQVTAEMTVGDALAAAGYEGVEEETIFAQKRDGTRAAGIKLTAIVNGFSALVLTKPVAGGNQ